MPVVDYCMRFSESSHVEFMKSIHEVMSEYLASYDDMDETFEFDGCPH